MSGEILDSSCRRMQVSLVDVDSRELISAWILLISATSPSVMRSYDVAVSAGRPIHKKIVYSNPWDVGRRLTLVSSDESIMRPRCGSRHILSNR